MPGKGGWDTLYELKKTPVTGGIPWSWSPCPMNRE